jgi:hypothetical protein
MILKSKLNLLTEDELCILLYCLNDGISGKSDEINMHNIQQFKPQFVFDKLNEHLPKIKQEHRTMLQAIADKVTGL